VELEELKPWLRGGGKHEAVAGGKKTLKGAESEEPPGEDGVGGCGGRRPRALPAGAVTSPRGSLLAGGRQFTARPPPG
jgi:hypothetical protein